jgi:hypothetical protein
MAMSTDSIVEHLDVVEDICSGEISCLVDSFFDAHLFQATKERFRDSIVPTVAASAHTRLEVVCFAEAQPVIAATATDKLRLHDGMPTEITDKSIDMKALANEFKQLSRQMREKQVNVVATQDKTEESDDE